jgi:hypothetical protein
VRAERTTPHLLVALVLGCASGTDEADESTFGSHDTTSAPAETSASTTGTDPSSGEADTATDDDDCLPVTWYRDADGDGRGDPNDTVVACSAPPGYVGPADDCDDTDPEIHPFADEVCDGVDNDCNGLVDEHSPHNAMCNGCTTAIQGSDGYWFCPEDVSWEVGRQRCAEMFAADLVTIDNGVVNAFMVERAPPGPTSWWIGLNDLEVEGTFVWPDGSPATYTNWNDGEPNNANGIEHCVELSSTTGGWNDIPCDGPRTYICGASPP